MTTASQQRASPNTQCKSFENVKRGEICKIPGATVTPSAPGTPTPIRLPQFQGDVFREVLFYIYTGKISLQDNIVFEVLLTAQALGVDELRAACEDHVSGTLNVHSACTFLTAAIEAQERISGAKSGSRSFVDRCIAYIGENAAECIKTAAFLSLTKDALIQLISSDFLSLEEEDVWRAVLTWAKHQAGVTQPVAHWTEEERARVCQHLAGVISHVRLLLIDSHVFAEEVEPTGAVPMELSLERYRFAALPTKFNHPQDKRLQPRVSLKMFPGSEILVADKLHFQRLLNSWYGVCKQQWRLLYRASSHGYSADAFHRHCDGICPTYTLVMGTQGEVCGGFSDVAWGKTSSKGRYVASEKAFLFSLINSSDLPPTKFDVVKKMFATAHHPESFLGRYSELALIYVYPTTATSVWIVIPISPILTMVKMRLRQF
uniref:TLDc domain-containing protein n=1 Tax=Strigamia maritima TaxID=126957 RepID=T1JBN3_STRMM